MQTVCRNSPRGHLFDVYNADQTENRAEMRTGIDIDDTLMAQVMESGEFKTKKAAVEEGLRLLAQVRTQGRIRALRDRLTWEGPLDDMRKDR